MSNLGTPPNNFPALAEGVKAWGLAHWTYIAVAVIANLVGVLFHI